MSVVTIMEMMMNKNVVFFYAESTVGFNKKKRNDTVMTYLNKICSRCTRRAYCICFDELCYCDSCYETMLNDPETKALMKIILKNYGQN